MYSEIKDTLPA